LYRLTLLFILHADAIKRGDDIKEGWMEREERGREGV